MTADSSIGESEFVECLEYIFYYNSLPKNKQQVSAEVLKSSFILNNKKYFQNNISKINEQDFSRVIRTYKNVEPEYLNSDEGKSFIEDCIYKYQSKNSDSRAMLLDVIFSKNSLSENYFTNEQYDKLFDFIINDSSYQNSIYFIFMLTRYMLYVSRDRIIDMIKTSDFTSKPRGVREGVYKALISENLLDKRFARRLRSDSSDELSKNCIAHFARRKRNYSDLQYNILYSQFIDTKHDSVALFVAKNIPDKLLPYAVSMTTDGARKIISEKMVEYTKLKGEKNVD